MRKNGLFIIAVVLSVFTLPMTGHAQADWTFEAKSLTSISPGGTVPFWFQTNKFGIIDDSLSSSQLSIEIKKKLYGEDFFEYSLGGEIVGRTSDGRDLFFHEAYGEVKIGPVNIYGGKKEWRDGLWRSEFSLGSMVWSGNAPTMPKVMAYTPEYIAVPGTNDFVAFKGYWGHGWFESDAFVDNIFLHEKALYMRILPRDFPFRGHVGTIHNAQWGGTHPRLGDLPDGLDDYKEVIFATAAEPGSAPGGEIVNALGNSVGAYEAYAEIELSDLYIQLYRQFYLETSVSADWRSPWDGIWGFQASLGDLTGNLVENILWEHVNTVRQNAKSGEEEGADDYYNNFIYENGWTYQNRVLGMPLARVGHFDGKLEVVNNIIIGHHFGIDGQIPMGRTQNPLEYELRITYSRNYGRTTNCSPNEFCVEEGNPLRTPRLDQWYNQLKVGYRVDDYWRVWTALGIDVGELQDEVGGFLGISYTFGKD